MINPWNPGQYVFGFAGVVSLNQQRIHPPAAQPLASTAGSTWYDAQHVLVKHFVNGENPIHLALLNVVTKQVGAPLLTVQHPSGGINEWCAGGARWAAYGFQDGAAFTSIDGWPAPGVVVKAIGFDGALAYSEDGSNHGLWLCPRGQMPNRTHDLQLEAPPAVVDSVRVYGMGQASYRVGGVPRVVGLPDFPAQIRTTVDALGWFSVVRLTGDRWGVLYQESEGLGRCVLHPPDDASRGWVVVESGRDAFRLEGALQPNGDRLIVYSSGQGDHPDQIQQAIVVASDPPIDLGAAPPPATGDDVMVRSFEHVFWFSPFYSHSEKYGDTPMDRHVGNAITIVEREGDPAVLLRELATYLPLGQPLIVQGDVQPLPAAAVNQTIALWTGSGTIGQLGERVERAFGHAAGVPVVAYLDGDGWPASRPSWLTARVAPSVQAYRRAAESLPAFRTRLERALARVAGYGNPIALTPRFDDPDQAGSAWSLEDTLETMLLVEEWIRGFQPAFVMPFSDRRGHGIAHHSELWQHARALQFAVPCGRPGRYDNLAAPATTRDRYAVAMNKLGQSRRLVSLEPWLRDDVKTALAFFYDASHGDPNTPVAPDARWAVEYAMRSHPDLNTQDEQEGGRIIDFACFHAGDPRWGRKARREDGSNKNRDAMCWLRDPATRRFEIYDAILGSDPGGDDPARFASWSFKGVFDPGENGWWAPPEAL